MIGVSDHDPGEKYELFSRKTNKLVQQKKTKRATMTSPTSGKPLMRGSLKQPNFPQSQGSYAQLYCRQMKKTESLIDPKGFPTMFEIVQGIWTYYCESLEQKIENSMFGDALK